MKLPKLDHSKKCIHEVFGLTKKRQKELEHHVAKDILSGLHDDKIKKVSQAMEKSMKRAKNMKELIFIVMRFTEGKGHLEELQERLLKKVVKELRDVVGDEKSEKADPVSERLEKLLHSQSGPKMVN